MATLTLRNVPDDLVARLKDRARRHRRSLNSETIAALELVDAAAEGQVAPQAPEPLDREAALARIRAIQARFPGAAKADQQRRTSAELQAELEAFAHLRGMVKGPAIPTDDLVAAVERDSHPTDSDHFHAVQKTSQ
jgi:plasmid stability protein